jgi:hypothetical protein
VSVEPGRYGPIAPYFVKAAAELGYPELDLNGPYDEGMLYYKIHITHLISICITLNTEY